MVVERIGSAGGVLLHATTNAEESLDRAEEAVGVGGVANDFASDTILLVSELESSVRGTLHDVRVIQRCLGGFVDGAIDGELDVLKFKGLGASARRVGLAVFGRPQEPVECDNDQIDDGFVEGAVDGMFGVESFREFPDDGHVTRVDSAGRVVFVLEVLEHISE